MVRFSGAALSSLAALCATAGGASASASASAAVSGRRNAAVDHHPPVGTHTVEILPTSSILLDQIRDALLDDAAAANLRGDDRRRDLLDRFLRTAYSHPRSALDESLVSRLHPTHPARKLRDEHNVLVEEFESSRALSRYETDLRRRLGLFPFGDLDAASALDATREGYGPLGQLDLMGNGGAGAAEKPMENEGGHGRSLQYPPPPQPGQPGAPPPQQPGQPAPGQPGGPPPQPGQPAAVPPPQPGQPGAVPPPQPGQPGGPPPQPGQPGIPGQPGDTMPPPPPNVVPPAPPEAGGQPGLEAPAIPPPQPGQPGYVPPPQPGQPGYVPGQPGEAPPPQPGQPGYVLPTPPPQPGQPGYVPGQPGDAPPPPQPGQPGAPEMPGAVPPPQPGMPGDVPPPQPGQPGAPGMPGAVPPPQPGQPGYVPPPQPGQPGYVPGTAGQPGAPGMPGTVPPPQPGQPGYVPGTPGSSEALGAPGMPGQPGVPGQPPQPGQPGYIPGTAGSSEEALGAPGMPGQPGDGADPALYAGLGPVILNETQTNATAMLNETQTINSTVPGTVVPIGAVEEQQQPGQPGVPGQPGMPGQPGQPGMPGAEGTVIAVVAAATAIPTVLPSSVPSSLPSLNPTDVKVLEQPGEPGQPGQPQQPGQPGAPGEPGQPQQPGQPGSTLPSDTPAEVVIPPDAPPDAALPPGFDEGGEILTGGLLNSYQTVPLLQGLGTHYSSVWVGSPNPQRVSVIVDTGSHFTAFPCQGCDKCGEEHHTDNYFHPSESTSFKPLECSECSDGARCNNGQCTFGQSYTEGSSWKAYEARDRFFCSGARPEDAKHPVDNSYAINFMFGCQTSLTGLFVGQLADGIMGMAAHEATLVKNMYEQSKIQHLMFAMCFRRELDASKDGVTAGVLTLGGVDARLQRSPMVYARNKVHDGWFTVNVKKLYLRPNGGQSAAEGGGTAGLAFGDAHTEVGNEVSGLANPTTVPGKPQPIVMNPSLINSGKGVIVDSGTTDTYFHRALGVRFGRMWKSYTGKDYNNKGMKLSRQELMRLPTLLVQLEAYDDSGAGASGAPGGSGIGADGTPAEQGEETIIASEHIPGTAAAVDPSSPNDVLLAIPASHYMEFSPKDRTYTSRIYFSESSGGVLGANAMMGHDVLFDMENGRVGFSESNCEYMDVVSVSEGGDNGADDGGVLQGNDCRLSVPTLSEGCAKTVDMALCDTGDDSTVLTGTEKWSMVVESPGTPAGMSCEEVMLRDVLPGEQPPLVSCDGNGLCFTVQPCHITCSEAKTDDITGAIPADEDEALAFESTVAGGEDQRCGNDLWGACEYSCNQTRVTSTLMSDGECHATSVEMRACHVDACGRSDPCRVPFVVHAILAFRGANAPLFTGKYRERFVESFASTVNMNRVGKDELFGPGDVKVLSANHWYENDIEETSGGERDGTPVGMKLIVEISIFNPNARVPQVVYEPLEEESPEDVAANETNVDAASMGDVKVRAKQTLDAMISAVRNAWNNLGGPPRATCDESDIYPLSRTALHVHMELERSSFMKELIIELMESGGTISNYDDDDDDSSWSDPFNPMYKTQSYQDNSKFLSSWTVKTEIGGGTFHDHSGDFPTQRGFNKDYVMYYMKTNAQILLVVFAALLCVCCAGTCCGRTCARRRYEAHAASLMEKLASRADERRRGQYAKVGEGDDGDSDGDDEMGFANVGYRDHPAEEDYDLGEGCGGGEDDQEEEEDYDLDLGEGGGEEEDEEGVAADANGANENDDTFNGESDK